MRSGEIARVQMWLCEAIDMERKVETLHQLAKSICNNGVDLELISNITGLSKKKLISAL